MYWHWSLVYWFVLFKWCYSALLDFIVASRLSQRRFGHTQPLHWRRGRAQAQETQGRAKAEAQEEEEQKEAQTQTQQQGASGRRGDPRQLTWSGGIFQVSCQIQILRVLITL